ncbi:glycoside hydrolase family 108 protein [Shinella kummerowiae]|uniref:glycoside hydrolase family 108 protein n=1 Tax=Shinella kummerowiae TaxID=417745 RepID=UPI0021B4FED9|nr:glycosyl hydrolase 108 family protein [Shinella kummerowiae]MCT7662319.1 secretion activator protein [Shinella kummerowiae]
MSDRFAICHPITAAWEGGWSDHKADPGGKTMYGVTEAVFHAWLKAQGKAVRPVKSITKAEALAIYRKNYWDACGAPTLKPGVDLAVYDASVNSGVSRGLKWLKASIGSNDHSVTVKRICRARLSFMQSLKIWQSFGRGWGRRVADIEVKGVAMALGAMGATEKRIRADAAAEAEAAKKAAKTADTTAKTTGAGGVSAGGATAIDAGAMDPAALWVLGAIAALAIGAAVVLYVKKRAYDARAVAYAEAAA